MRSTNTFYRSHMSHYIDKALILSKDSIFTNN